VVRSRTWTSATPSLSPGASTAVLVNATDPAATAPSNDSAATSSSVEVRAAGRAISCWRAMVVARSTVKTSSLPVCAFGDSSASTMPSPLIRGLRPAIGNPSGSDTVLPLTSRTTTSTAPPGGVCSKATRVPSRERLG
jgi:hypothetical protein